MNSKWSECPPRLDRWTICDKGHTHWGAIGAAGILFCHLGGGAELTYLLERRWSTVDHNGSWCIPGGAIRRGESAETAAQREAAEEIGPLPYYEVTKINIQECGGGWKFYILTATVARPFLAYCVSETDAVGWFTREGMRSLSLHPGLQKWLGEQQSLGTCPDESTIRRWVRLTMAKSSKRLLFQGSAAPTYCAALLNQK